MSMLTNFGGFAMKADMHSPRPEVTTPVIHVFASCVGASSFHKNGYVGDFAILP